MPSRDPVIGAQRRHVGAVERDPAAERPVRAGDGAKERGLAGAVRADQRDDLAFVDREIDVAHRLQQAVADVEPLDREQAHAMPPPR